MIGITQFIKHILIEITQFIGIIGTRPFFLYRNYSFYKNLFHFVYVVLGPLDLKNKF